MTREHFYITTPIYYVNAAPHLGTAYTTIAADCVARFQRMSGKDVRFVTGSDEHGQKIADTAAKNGTTPIEWCDSQIPAFKDAWEMLDITYSEFVRTSSKAQEKSVQKLWQDLYDRGYLYKGSYEGWYCVHEETYYAESDLEKDEEGNFVCPECKRPVQKASGEENWFFKLSDFQEKLLEYYETHPDFILPVTRKNEIVSFVKSGLKDLSISRSTFDWGVPFTFDEGHVAYVWADALIAYLTGIGFADEARLDEFNNFWPANYHFVGKDITRFHCVIWPAMLMAAGLPIPEHVFGHGFLLTKGEKMSKSKGNALSPKELVNIFGVDAYRYYFMSDVQFGADGSISIERMCQVYNADLANTWGNLVSRVTNMTKKYFDFKVPQPSSDAINNPMAEMTSKTCQTFIDCMDAVDFSGATKAAMELAHRANLYIEESEPWTLAKDESKAQQLADVIYNTLEAIRLIALMLAPFCTRTSVEASRRIGAASPFEVEDLKSSLVWGQLKAGSSVEIGDALFPRLDEDKILAVED